MTAQQKENLFKKQHNPVCIECSKPIFLDDLPVCEVIVTRRKNALFIHKECIKERKTHA